MIDQLVTIDRDNLAKGRVSRQYYGQADGDLWVMLYLEEQIPCTIHPYPITLCNVFTMGNKPIFENAMA